MNATNNKPFAEVIESSLHSWLAQSWKWDMSPDYGSLVTVDQNSTTYVGLVHEVSTGSMDPTRYPFTYQKTEQELLKEQPQIFEFLKTTFSCIILGYCQKGQAYHLAPPRPAKIHSFVQPIASDLNEQFLSHEQYVHRIFSLSNLVSNIDELLFALLAKQNSNQAFTKHKLDPFMHAYCLLTGNDYRRIKLFLRRVEQIIK